MNIRGITRIEKIVISIFLFAILLILIPLYLNVRDQQNTGKCIGNLKDIWDAIKVYREDHNGLLPPAYYRLSDGSPELDAKGRPKTWVIPLANYLKKRTWNIFRCPGDPTGGSTLITDLQDSSKTISLSYGFYLPMSGLDTSAIPDVDQMALIADSVAGGLLETLYAHRLAEGNDGFVLLPDDVLGAPTKNSKLITRLPVVRRDDKGSWSGENLQPLFHGSGINVLMADGFISTRSPAIVQIMRNEKGEIESPWALPQRQIISEE